MRRLRTTGLVAGLAALAACGRCGGAAGPPPERLVPSDALGALIVPELQGAARSLAEFYSAASGFPGTSELPALRASLSTQLGFDPLSLRSLRDAGIDPRGGLALAFLARTPEGPARGPTTLIVLPVSNRAAADATVGRIAGERLGARERTVEAIGAVHVAVYRQGAGSPAALAVGDCEGCMVLAAGPAGPAAVARALSLAPGGSLATSEPWKVALRAAGEEPDAIAFVPPGSPALEGLWAVRDGGALALSAEPGKLRARAVLLLGDREPGFRALAPAAGGPATGGALAARLDPASAVVGRFDGDPEALGRKVVPMLPASERALLARAGVDLERDLFAGLGPGGAGAISLAPRIDLATLDARSLRSDPLRLVQFEIVVPVREPARLAALSERLTRLAGQRSRTAPFAIPTRSGEVAWAVEGDRLVLAGGAPKRLAALRERLGEAAGGYRAPTDASRKALAGGGLGALVIDTQNFAASVRALPPEAFGTGPTGFVMRALAERIVDPAERIDGVSIRAELLEGALVLALEVEPKASPEGGP